MRSHSPKLKFYCEVLYVAKLQESRAIAEPRARWEIGKIDRFYFSVANRQGDFLVIDGKRP